MWKAVFKVWNEADHFIEALSAVYGLVEQIIVIDGAYRYFPYNESETYNAPHSTDGTLEIARKLGEYLPATERKSEIIIVSRPGIPWDCETQMINHVFRNFGKKGDYFFMIDGHEILEGDFPTQREIITTEKWRMGKVIVYRPTNTQMNIPIEQYANDWEKISRRSQFRILKWHPKLMLFRRHWNYVLEQTGQLDKLSHDHRKYKVPRLIRLRHMTRNKERERINMLHKRGLSRFKGDEINLLKWRRKEKVKDGYIGWDASDK